MSGRLGESDLVRAIAALAQEHRLAAFRALVARGPAGLPAGALARRLALAPSALSFHLAHLQAAGLVRSWRAGRQVFYAADERRAEQVMAGFVGSLCGDDPRLVAEAARKLLSGEREPTMSRLYNVLFLCTANSARSIMAEAILARMGMGRFTAHSAGSQPRGTVHPYALDLLKHLNHPTAGLRSKPWEEFAAPGAPPLDFVFTVCDNAAAEVCPIWPGQPVSAHWGVPDPAAAEGTEAEKRLAFDEAYRMLSNRISIFIALPIDGLDRLALQKRVEEIGRALPAGVRASA